MTQAEIARRLQQIHFGAKWPKAEIARRSGLASRTIDRALGGFMTALTQSRLTAIIRTLPASPPAKKKGFGKKRRFTMRMFNLKKWIAEIESHTGLRRFKDRKHYGLTEEEMGYVCAKLDYKMKWYLLHLFGMKLKAKNVTLGDCWSAEQWVKRIASALPREQEVLMKVLARRGR